MNVWLICGRTGGHFNPALALGKYLNRDQSVKTSFLTSQKGLDYIAIEKAGMPFVSFQDYSLLKQKWFRILDVLYLIGVNFWKSIIYIIKHRIDVIVGVGGLLSVAPVIAGFFLRRKTIIIEPNIVWGKANKILKYISTYQAVWLLNDRSANCYQTGVPIRSEFLQLNQEILNENMNQKLSIMIMGGSQGARFFNQVIPSLLKECCQNNNKIIVHHISGKNQKEKVSQIYEGSNFQYFIYDYVDDMYSLFKSIDLVICRAGASTLAELSVLGKPSILIPFPFSADNHQLKNAQYFALKNACLLFKEDQSIELLKKMIQTLINDSSQLEMVSLACQKFSSPNASELIKKLIDQKSA